MKSPKTNCAPANRCLFSVLVTILVFQSPQLLAQAEPDYYRIQHHKFHWQAYIGDRFCIYMAADANENLYRFIVREVPTAIEKVKKATMKELPKNLNIIVYPSVDQHYETNIGCYEAPKLTLPTFINRGTRVVLAYEGSLAELKKQLEESLVRSLWESQIQGTNEKQQTKKTTNKRTLLPNDGIPFWYKEGAIRYFAHGWPTEAEDNFRRSIMINNFSSWQQIIDFEPRLAGHAFCYYLTQKYYPTVTAQTVFQLQKTKSLARAIRLITKQELDSLFTDCFQYYNLRFQKPSDLKGLQPIKYSNVISHKKGIVQQLIANSDGRVIAYCVLTKGRREVWIHNVNSNKRTRVTSYALPPWIDDHSKDKYPLISWDINSQLFVTTPQKGKIVVKRFNSDGHFLESTFLKDIDGLCDLQPLPNNDFLLSAFKNGQSDIVNYKVSKEEYKPYTDDVYDDSNPILSDSGVIFVSNRPKEYEAHKTKPIEVENRKDTLRQGIYSAKNNSIQQIAVDTVNYSIWGKPMWLKGNEFLATTTRTGTERWVMIDQTNGIKKLLNNYQPIQYLNKTRKIVTYSTDRDSIYLSEQTVEKWLSENISPNSDTSSPWLNDYKRTIAKRIKDDSVLNRKKDTTRYIMDDVFASKGDNKNIKRKQGNNSKQKSDSLSTGTRPYRLQLHSAYFTATVNNDYFINRYQPYLNYQGTFKFPEISGMTKGGFTDLFENHHFSIAFALPAAAEGSTFFVNYLNTENKLDWGLSYYRKVETLEPDPSRNWVDENGNRYPENAKVKTHYYEALIRYPLSYYSALRFSSAIRQDETIFLATDMYTLNFPSLVSSWFINTFSYRLNKLKTTLPYLNKGFKILGTVDIFKGFNQRQYGLIGCSFNMQYHKPFYKFITLVSQLQGGCSGGDAKVLYNLGGVDNNVTPRVDASVHFSQTAPYAFQNLVTPFRGYYQNQLYGNQYLLCSEDLYFPIFQTLFPITTSYSVINNLQLGILNDLASASETWNKRNTNNGIVLWSYGLSARSVLAGYPLRLEVAWPGSFSKQPVWYFSLKL